MSVGGFFKGFFIMAMTGLFLFSGGCALIFSVDCLSKNRCGLEGLFIFPGTLIAFVTISILLLMIKHSKWMEETKRVYFSFFSVVMLLICSLFSCFIIYELIKSVSKNADLDNLLNGFIYIGLYMGVLIFCTYFVVQTRINMYKKAKRSIKLDNEE